MQTRDDMESEFIETYKIQNIKKFYSLLFPSLGKDTLKRGFFFLFLTKVKASSLL